MDTIVRPQTAPTATLEDLERRALWLSSWTIHHANHLRESRDGLKVGGHQASCASSVTLLAALYGHALRPEDRIAVKPHAAPVMHAIIYLMGLQNREPLERAPGRMIALMGDAELDEGTVFEALLAGWKQDVRNIWWVIAYNRPSL